MVLRSKELLLYYIMYKLLKGVSEPTPLFRLAKTQADNKNYFNRTLIRLNGKEKTRKYLDITNQYKDFLKFI